MPTRNLGSLNKALFGMLQEAFDSRMQTNEQNRKATAHGLTMAAAAEARADKRNDWEMDYGDRRLEADIAHNRGTLAGQSADRDQRDEHHRGLLDLKHQTLAQKDQHHRSKLDEEARQHDNKLGFDRDQMQTKIDQFNKTHETSLNIRQVEQIYEDANNRLASGQVDNMGDALTTSIADNRDVWNSLENRTPIGNPNPGGGNPDPIARDPISFHPQTGANDPGARQMPTSSPDPIAVNALQLQNNRQQMLENRSNAMGLGAVNRAAGSAWDFMNRGKRTPIPDWLGQ